MDCADLSSNRELQEATEALYCSSKRPRTPPHKRNGAGLLTFLDILKVFAAVDKDLHQREAANDMLLAASFTCPAEQRPQQQGSRRLCWVLRRRSSDPYSPVCVVRWIRPAHAVESLTMLTSRSESNVPTTICEAFKNGARPQQLPVFRQHNKIGTSVRLNTADAPATPVQAAAAAHRQHKRLSRHCRTRLQSLVEMGSDKHNKTDHAAHPWLASQHPESEELEQCNSDQACNIGSLWHELAVTSTRSRNSAKGFAGATLHKESKCRTTHWHLVSCRAPGLVLGITILLCWSCSPRQEKPES